MARRSLDGRPIQPRLLGTKRPNGIISKVAASRFAEPLNSPISSSKAGKSLFCKTCANCVICCRKVSFIWASGLGCLVDSYSLTPRGPLSKQSQAVLFYFNDFAQFCKRLGCHDRRLHARGRSGARHSARAGVSHGIEDYVKPP